MATCVNERIVVNKMFIMGILDFSNAFNAIDREAMFQQVRKVIPSIAVWVEFCYRAEPILFVGNRQIRSSCGVQQGDPLGPLLFAITLHPLVLKIQSECPSLLLNKWYLDDGTIFGLIEDVHKAFLLVRREGPNYGLFLNEKKSILFNGLMDLEALDCFPPDIIRCQDSGVKFLGAGAGDAVFMNHIAQKRVDKIKSILSIAKGLEDPQLELLLLRSCIGIPKFSFLLRMCPPERISAAINNLDAEVDSFLAHVLNIPAIDQFKRMEVALPISHGGLGIPIVKNVAPIQFMSAQRGFVLSMNPSSDLASVANNLTDRLANWNSELELKFHVDSAEFMSVPRRPQSLLNSSWCASQQAILLLNASGAQCKRLASNFDSPALWTVAPPIPGLRFTMDPGPFRIALRFRLGLDIRGCRGPCSYCQSGQLDKLGIHDSRCKKIWSVIHNRVRDDLFVLLKRANLDARKEVADLFRDGTEDRPADILLSHPTGKSVCLDLSCISYDVLNGLHKRDADKIKKYGIRCEQVNLDFVPLSFNSLGAISDPFRQFLKSVARSISDLSTSSTDSALANTIQAIQFSIIRVISESIHDRVANDLVCV